MIADGKDDNGYYLVATKVEDKNIYLNLKAGETFLSSNKILSVDYNDYLSNDKDDYLINYNYLYLNLKAGETFLSSGDEALVELQEMRQQLS